MAPDSGFILDTNAKIEGRCRLRNTLIAHFKKIRHLYPVSNRRNTNSLPFGRKKCLSPIFAPFNITHMKVR